MMGTSAKEKKKMKHKQKIIVFPAHHSRLPSNEIKTDQLLNCSDCIGVPSAGLFFFYAQDAPAILLPNLNSSLRLVNGCRGYMNDIILDPVCKNLSIMLRTYILMTYTFRSFLSKKFHYIIFAPNRPYVFIFKDQIPHILTLII
jgi:hypothetical protein